MPPVVGEVTKPGCVICEFVMHRVREWLQDGHTQDEIQEGLDEICSLMPQSVKVSKLLRGNIKLQRHFKDFNFF